MYAAYVYGAWSLDYANILNFVYIVSLSQVERLAEMERQRRQKEAEQKVSL